MTTCAEVNVALRDLTDGALEIEAHAAEDDSGCIVFAEHPDGLRHALVPFPSDAMFTLPEFVAALRNGRLPAPLLRSVA